MDKTTLNLLRYGILQSACHGLRFMECFGVMNIAYIINIYYVQFEVQIEASD